MYRSDPVIHRGMGKTLDVALTPRLHPTNGRLASGLRRGLGDSRVPSRERDLDDVGGGTLER